MEFTPIPHLGSIVGCQEPEAGFVSAGSFYQVRKERRKGTLPAQKSGRSALPVLRWFPIDIQANHHPVIPNVRIGVKAEPQEMCKGVLSHRSSQGMTGCLGVMKLKPYVEGFFF